MLNALVPCASRFLAELKKTVNVVLAKKLKPLTNPATPFHSKYHVAHIVQHPFLNLKLLT